MSESVTATHVRWEDVDLEAMSPTIGRQFVVGNAMMIARVLLKEGAHVPLHHHSNEQISYILEGALRFLVGGREVIVRAGEVLCIPSDLPHEAFALEDTVDVDIFNPPRQDWINKDDSYLRQADDSQA
jgi:quercetin dioxygenase-like cupin family protein